MRNKGNNCNTSNYHYYYHNKNTHRKKVELILKFKVVLLLCTINRRSIKHFKCKQNVIKVQPLNKVGCSNKLKRWY